MTGDGDVDELDELLAAYVIDALERGERDEIDIYLDANPAKRAEVLRLTTAFDALVTERMPAATPPPDLWDRIEAQLGDEGKPVLGVPTIVTEPPPPARADAGGHAATTDELSARRRRRSGGRLVAAAVAIAAALALVMVGLALRPKEADQTLAAAQVERQATQAERQAGSTSASLTGADLDVHVVLDANGHMYVVPTELPPLSDDQALQLWALDSGTPVSLGVLRGAASMELPAGQHPTKVAISKEPATGSSQPTTTPLAAGQLS